MLTGIEIANGARHNCLAERVIMNRVATAHENYADDAGNAEFSVQQTFLLKKVIKL